MIYTKCLMICSKSFFKMADKIYGDITALKVLGGHLKIVLHTDVWQDNMWHVLLVQFVEQPSTLFIFSYQCWHLLQESFCVCTEPMRDDVTL